MEFRHWGQEGFGSVQGGLECLWRVNSARRFWASEWLWAQVGAVFAGQPGAGAQRFVQVQGLGFGICIDQV